MTRGNVLLSLFLAGVAALFGSLGYSVGHELAQRPASGLVVIFQPGSIVVQQ